MPSPLGGHDRGRVFVGLACAITDGVRVINDFRVMGEPAGAVWPDRVGFDGPGRRMVTAAVSSARGHAWAQGIAPHGTVTPVRGTDRKSAAQARAHDLGDCGADSRPSRCERSARWPMGVVHAGGRAFPVVGGRYRTARLLYLAAVCVISAFEFGRCLSVAQGGALDVRGMITVSGRMRTPFADVSAPTSPRLTIGKGLTGPADRSHHPAGLFSQSPAETWACHDKETDVPKYQSTAAKKARAAARQGGAKYTAALRDEQA